MLDTEDRYTCCVCGYVYQPEKGDGKASIDPSTPFEQLPVNWRCPLCGADLVLFEKVGKNRS